MKRPPRPGKSITGLDENLAAALAYVLGVVSGAVFLLIGEENRYVRFHALQSVCTFGTIAVLLLIIGVLPLGGVLTRVAVLGVTVLWVFLIIKALQGVRYGLPFVGAWVEQHLK